jgi:hypothetical protein
LCDLPRVTRFIESPHGEVRFRAALEWLSSLERHRPLLIVAHSLEAARDLLRAATLAEHATFGWALESLTSLAMRLAALPLAERRLSIATPLALEAVAVRVVSELGAAGKLGRFEHVADRPGLPQALLRTFTDLALADVDLGRLEAESPELAVAFEHYRRTLAELRLADRATVLEQAIAAVATRAAAGELEAVCRRGARRERGALDPNLCLRRGVVEPRRELSPAVEQRPGGWRKFRPLAAPSAALHVE